MDAHSTNHHSFLMLLLFDTKSVLFFALFVGLFNTHAVNVAGHARYNKEEKKKYQPCERMHNHIWRKVGPVNVVVR